MDWGFAGLHQLLVPFLGGLGGQMPQAIRALIDADGGDGVRLPGGFVNLSPGPPQAQCSRGRATSAMWPGQRSR